MRRVLYPFVIVCLILCSCKNRSSQTQSTSVPAKAPVATPAKPLAATILEFYKAYCANWDGESKTDSILSMYCTQELKDYVMDCVGEYDFVLNGGIYADIHPESFCVVKRNEKFIVYYEYTKWPVSEEPGRDSLYIMVNKENKISYVIRPGDNYRVPAQYDREKLYTFDDYEYVDLGLSVKWATCNIGASKYNTVSYGDFFAWGETETRYAFDKNYYLEPKQGHYYDGNLSVLEPSDDAATVLWGKEWRLPTKEEFQELIDFCQWEWTEVYDHWGYKVTGPNGNIIFLPVGGMKTDNRWLYYNDGLYYWTSSCKFSDPEREPRAWMFLSVADGPDPNKNRRMDIALTPLSVQSGRLIRPVTTMEYIPIKDIGINKKELKLEIGDEYTLTASFIPQNATKRNIYWESGNSAVAHVGRNGKVTAVSSGKCTVAAVCGNIRTECQVTVVMPKDYVPEYCKVTTVYEFGKEVNKTFIDNLQDFNDSLKLTEVFKTHIGDKSDGFDITLSDLTREEREEWDGDPGDYCTVTIETTGGQYRFKNGDWVYNDIFENGYFHCYRIDKSKYLVFLRGFDYGCCPGVLTVLAVDETGARVVYNKECKLDEINIEPFSMTIEDWYAESVSKYKTYYSNAHNLFIEDGALKIKDVKLLRE